MGRRFRAIGPFLLAPLAAGCISAPPKPLDPAESEAAFRTRTLTGEGLRAFVAANAPDVTWPPGTWDLRLLTLAAFHYHPDLVVAKARAGVAEAATETAGARPNPTIGVAPGRANPTDHPWLLGFTFDVPIETAGKRSHRIEGAERRADAARIAVGEAAWKVRDGVRAALLAHLLARDAVAVATEEEAARARVLDIARRRLEAGDVGQGAVDVAQTEADRARVAVRAAEADVAGTRAALAAAVGVPARALDGIDPAWPGLDAPPPLDDATVRRASVLDRLDVRRALAEYAAAEADLQLEVAKQVPDVHLVPGYDYDEGVNKFTLGLSLELPLFHRNEGPIAEALARRQEVAARFLATQARAIGDAEIALARYRGALAELAEADAAATTLRDGRMRDVQRAFEAGETDAMAVTLMQTEAAAAARSRMEAVRHAQEALGALEDAVQRPLGPGADLPASLVKETPR
jgi:cobalt-zinc-cadmium efflux system outer membrane protein